MANNRRLWAVDCETDPAKYGRVPAPFIWGAYDGKTYLEFFTTEEFVAWARNQNAVLYAHNGGKFDFMFLLKYIGETKAQIINGRFVKMHLGKAELRDSVSIIPEKLEKFGKFKVDYTKFEANVRAKHMPEIRTYLKQDCVVLFELVSEYRRIAGKQITIASNALKFSKKLGINPGKTNHTYDKKMRPYFFGGRCQVFRGGINRLIRVIDIHSAYPFAMCHDHPNGNEFTHISDAHFDELTREEKQRCFIRLRCFSNGAFPLRSKTDLNFPIGENEFHISGWEYVAALELNLISNVEILDVISHRGTINFTPYVNHWYEYKAAHDKETNPIQYTIGKIMMNSLYGKMAQNPARYFDYKVMPCGSPICHDLDLNYGGLCDNCGEKENAHGFQVATEYEDIEIHRRPALWKYERKYGKAWEGQPLYNNVSTGASITGFTRAHLLRAIHAVGIQHVIYCDTDSIICDASASLDRLSLTDKLGDWADEGTGSIGYFAGKKVYGIKMDALCKKHKGNNEKCGDCGHVEKEHPGHPKLKIASKGSKLEFEDIEWIVTGKMTNNERQKIKDGERIVVWKNDFPSFSLAGDADFVVRNIRQTARAIPAPATN